MQNFILEKINRINHLGFVWHFMGRTKKNELLFICLREWNRPRLIYVALLTLKIDFSFSIPRNHSRFPHAVGVAVPPNKSQFNRTLSTQLSITRHEGGAYKFLLIYLICFISLYKYKSGVATPVY